LIVAVAVTGAILRSRGDVANISGHASSRIATAYLPVILVEWGLAAYVGRLGAERSRIPFLLGTRWNTFGRAIADVALALALGALIEGTELAWNHLQGGVRSASVVALLPVTGAERLTWILVAVSVGFCEELVYRGYLQMQMSAFTKSTTLAVALQAALFGVAHAEQGMAVIVRFAVYGLALGALAQARRSLLPGIACHVGVDIAAGWMALHDFS
jgi:membrane protease YdiL (CAAX protease family)